MLPSNVKYLVAVFQLCTAAVVFQKLNMSLTSWEFWEFCGVRATVTLNMVLMVFCLHNIGLDHVYVPKQYSSISWPYSYYYVLLLWLKKITYQFGLSHGSLRC